MDPKVFLLVVGVALASAKYTDTYENRDLPQSQFISPHSGLVVRSLEAEPQVHDVLFADTDAEDDDVDDLPSGRRCLFGMCVLNIKQ
ncbi:jg17216 [Pararge aegeria aegeria]|uniref:Jg17216 protein n=1 Tax=Pararge aegeria aegeria TaxID=348720 RepID=A0A8S4SBF9_9NEOP|nr:jg17216 [Pararge aegeria aegeria]